MKLRIILLAAGFALLLSCSHRQEKSRHEAEHFRTEVMLRTTPVKNQGQDQLCWIYAMLATIETEHLMQADSIDLSVAYMARQLLAEQARMVYAKGRRHHVSLRGMSTKALLLLHRYGAMPYTSYRMPENIDLSGLALKMQRSGEQAKAHLTGLAKLDEQTGKTLDDAIGGLPYWVFMLGCQYTPLEFAHSICAKDEYLALTSFSHHPFGESFVLEVPDNDHQDAFFNVPIDSLMRYVEHSLRTGHPVCWEGDTSEPGCDFHQGIARLPQGHKPISQESRQQGFDHAKTTDDHCMAIVGIARDDEGRRYYICKNSWGTGNPYGGYMYMEEDYLKAKTIAVIIPTAALPTMDQMIKGLRPENLF